MQVLNYLLQLSSSRRISALDTSVWTQVSTSMETSSFLLRPLLASRLHSTLSCLIISGNSCLLNFPKIFLRRCLRLVLSMVYRLKNKLPSHVDLSVYNILNMIFKILAPFDLSHLILVDGRGLTWHHQWLTNQINNIFWLVKKCIKHNVIIL